MSKVMWKPGTFLYPLPAALVSCGTMEKSNIITVAWTGIINTNPAMVYISVRPSRYSYKLIKEQSPTASIYDQVFLYVLFHAAAHILCLCQTVLKAKLSRD